MPSRAFHPAAHKAVRLTGALGVVLIVLAAAWLMLRDYRSTLRHAELTLDNFAIVLAVHTRLALAKADAPLLDSIVTMGHGAPAERVQRFFADLYGQVDLAYEGRIFVFRSDGTLVAVVPEAAEAAGRDFSTYPLFDAPFNDMVAGGIQSRGFIQPGARLITWRRIRDYPLLIAFSTSMSEVLAPWWRGAWTIGSGALLLAIAFFAGGWLLARQLEMRARLAREVAESEQRAAEELARSHEELREMYEAMHQVRESERTRIARELHDELAQSLTALKLDAAWIASRPPQEHADMVSTAERMKDMVADTIAAMRRIAADLRPVMLDDLGLVPAIDNLLHQLSERTGIQVSLRGDDHLVVREPLATALYRMVQEALTNVARHAEATEVVVELRAQDDRLRVAVRDNGRGLRLDPAHKSYGLLGMRERARTLGGKAEVHAAPGGGTIVEIDVPLKAYALSGAEP